MNLDKFEPTQIIKEQEQRMKEQKEGGKKAKKN
jgi:hypothetical protein